MQLRGVRCLVGSLGCGLEVAAKRIVADILNGRGSLFLMGLFSVIGDFGYA